MNTHLNVLSRRPSSRRAKAALAGLVAVLSSSLMIVTANPAQAAYTQIEGSGSTWSQGIVAQWISDVDANGMKITYNGAGSSQGRKDFASNVTDFGITEIPYQGKDEFGAVDTAGNREFAYMPIVAGGTAFTYQVQVGGKPVKDLRLSGDTIAKIFTNKITNWNDPAITKDNNGRKLPSLTIVPVVRSDGSGTTAQFTAWLDKQFPSIWQPYFGKTGLTSYYPKKSGSKMIGAAGSDQVMNTISSKQGNGTIGYVEYSYPVNKKYPVVKLLNKAGYFVEPTQYNVAVALTKAKINNDPSSQAYLTSILDGVYTSTDPRAYPLSSYSYMLLPTGAKDQRMTTSKRQTLTDFMFYSLCQGQSKAGPYGYSPLPLNLVQAGFDQLKKLSTADPAVDVKDRDVTKCNNPTFVAGDLSKNKLAQIAPQPPACDKVGAGPCGTATGTAPTTPEAAAKPGAAASAGGTPVDAAPAAGDAPAAVDPETGVATTTTDTATTASGETAVAVPTELVAGRAGDTKVFGALAALELIAIILAPGVGAVYFKRRARRKQGAWS
ncbi:substrate-binding domain-containing protein [Aeromicrobium sp. Root472D3]|uniref:substrate-binding domain-containing protein n=1 Tax=Aeromicrobium sp. Root472D3 TaxID=1736540 RepID=UPI000AC5C942|nr:substrate-binding domain-containing protein [Aeromicrobium sp. Root472D3]